MPSPLLRTAGKWLAIGTILIAIVATQWPFEYRFTSYAIHYRIARIDWRWFHHFDRDFVLNILMLMPLGFGFGLWRQSSRVRVVIESLALGTLSSAILELAQLVTRDRYTSFLDVWHNAVGCVAGCVIAIVVSGAHRDRSDPRSPRSP
jgi:glycopeptide antibiotics resistance protein